MSEKWFGINRNEIDWYPKIDYEKCSSCMACLEKCKNNVFEHKENKVFVINQNNCVVGCTGCQAVCPTNAITHPPKSYLEKLTNKKDFKIGCSCGEK